MKIYSVMYHYVLNEKEDQFNGIFPIWEKEFERQIKWLKKNFEVIDPKLLSKDFTSTKIYKTTKPKCILTFDDGTKDQMRNAVRLLDKHNTKACFFVLSDVLIDKIMPIAQLLHLVLCYFNPDKIIDHLFKNRIIDSKFDKEIEKIALDIYDYEKDVGRAYLKYIVNFYLDSNSHTLKESLISLMSKLFTEKEMVDYWFMSIDDLILIQKNGHTIGNHGRIHKPYESMSFKDLKDDIEKSHSKLSAIFNNKIDTYAHPFGGDDSKKNIHAISVLKKLGYSACFNVIPKVNEKDLDRFDLNRFDATSLPDV
jgi:peptidoglycan/xylan/chitin deacetylase (PgdA/CDA1 family)